MWVLWPGATGDQLITTILLGLAVLGATYMLIMFAEEHPAFATFMGIVLGVTTVLLMSWCAGTIILMLLS